MPGCIRHMTLVDLPESARQDLDEAVAAATPVPPPPVHPTLVLMALAMGGFAIGTTEFAAMSLLPAFAPDLGIDAPTAGHVISAYALGVVVGAPVIAVLAARIARRTLLIGLMTLFALGNMLSAVAPSYHWMLAFRFIAGLPHGAYFGVAALVAASLVPRAKRSQAVSRVIAGLTIATVVGVPLANGIGQLVGWRWSFGHEAEAPAPADELPDPVGQRYADDGRDSEPGDHARDRLGTLGPRHQGRGPSVPRRSRA